LLTSLTATLIVAGVTAGDAFNPGTVDILGITLGMTEAQIDAQLLRQGIPAGRVKRETLDCADVPCPVTVTALTKDGVLTIHLAQAANLPAPSPPVTMRIRYAIKERAAGEPAMIEGSILDRFGRPDQPEPMT
jgi:hypothetical protein